MEGGGVQTGFVACEKLLNQKKKGGEEGRNVNIQAGTPVVRRNESGRKGGGEEANMVYIYCVPHPNSTTKIPTTPSQSSLPECK